MWVASERLSTCTKGKVCLRQRTVYCDPWLLQTSHRGLLEGRIARRSEIVISNTRPEPEDLHRFHRAQEENAMLVLSRKRGERIVIGPTIELTVVDIHGDRVRLAVDAPRDVSIHREEIYRLIQDESRHEGATPDCLEKENALDSTI